jgi:hypothetical protein
VDKHYLKQGFSEEIELSQSDWLNTENYFNLMFRMRYFSNEEMIQKTGIIK